MAQGKEISRGHFWLITAGLCLTAAFAALPRLGWSLSTDEPWSLLLVRQGMGAMQDWFMRDTAQPLYYWLLRGWYLLVGEDDFLLRLPSLAFYLAALALTGWTGRKWSGSLAGLLAAALMAGSHLLGTVKAASLRPYSLTVLETAAALALFGLLWQAPQSKPARAAAWLALTLLYWLALLTHTVFLFFMAAAGLAAVWRGGRFFIAHGLAAAGGVLLFLLSYGPYLTATLGIPSRSWMSTPGLTDLGLAAARLWGAAAVVPLGLMAAALLRRRTREPIWKVWAANRQLPALLTLVLAAVLGPFLVGQFYPVFEESRTPVLFLVPASLLTGAALGRLFSRRAVLAAVAAIAVLAWGGGALGFFIPERAPTRASLRAVQPQVQCGDVFLSAGLAYNAVEVYRQRDAVLADCTTHRVFPAEMTQHPGWIDRTGMLTNGRAELTAEAARQAADLKEQRPVRVWVFARSDPFDSILLTELEKTLGPGAYISFTGNYFDAIRVYTLH